MGLKRIAISEENDRLLMTECKDEIFRVHPELRGMVKSRDAVIGFMIPYFLKKSIFELK